MKALKHIPKPKALPLAVGLLACLLLVALCVPASSQASEQPSRAAPANAGSITVSIEVEGYAGSLPVLSEGTDFDAGSPIRTDPRFMVDGNGNQPLSSLIESKEAQGYSLVWQTEDGQDFDWFETPVTQSITVQGSFEKAPYLIRVCYSDTQTADIEQEVQPGSSFEQAHGSVPEPPERTGYTFVNWIDAATGAPFDFTKPVTSSATVYAHYEITEPDQVVTVDPTIDVPKTASGRCYIGATWSVHPAQFSVSDFTGELSGCSGTGSCSLASAAAPSHTWADYHATLRSVDVEAGLVTYDVTITPPGVASPNGPRNSLGLIGYQTVYFQAQVQKNFGGYVKISKSSANPAMSDGNRMYSLEGAIFGVYDKHGKRVAELVTDAQGNSEQSPLLPVGTYTIKEESAPAGYANAADKSVAIQSGKVTTTDVPDVPQSALVDLLLQKVDRETGAPVPLGSATLEGAQFRVSYYDQILDIPDLVSYAAKAFPDLETSVNKMLLENWGTPLRSWTFETDAAGTISFSEDYLVQGDDFYHDLDGAIALPLGTVVIEEVKAPEGYLLMDEPIVVAIPESGEDAHVAAWTCVQAPEQVKRGDLSFTKTREGSMDHLAGVPFKITSQTTDESHQMVTDENGTINTEASWIPHTQNTNQGATAEDGIWFEQDREGNVAPVNDDLGALPYDTYTIEELPCAANENMKLIAFEVTISRDHVTLDLGTIDNVPIPPDIGGEVDKRETLMDDQGAFAYAIDYRSTSDTWADEFTMTDTLTCAELDQAYLTSLTTPVSFEDYDGFMNVWYKTNKAEGESTKPSEATVAPGEEDELEAEGQEGAESEDGTVDIPESEVNACATNPYNPDNPQNKRMFNFEGWHLWKQNVSTLEAETLQVNDLGLAQDEHITALAFEHGRVEEGFGTMPQDASEWNDPNRHNATDVAEAVGEHPYTFDTALAGGLTATAEPSEHPYAPAILHMQATEKTLGDESVEIWNKTAIDIYRNLNLHDEEEDSVVQTTYEEKTPFEELVSHLPKTGDMLWLVPVGAGALAPAAAAAVVISRRRRHG